MWCTRSAIYIHSTSGSAALANSQSVGYAIGPPATVHAAHPLRFMRLTSYCLSSANSELAFFCLKANDPTKLTAMAERDAKRRCITKFLALHNVTASSLAVILGDLLPGGCSRWDIREVLKGHFAALLIRLPLPCPDGTSVDWSIAKLQLLLPHVIGECDGFRRVFERALSTYPCTRDRKWRLIVYFDDITPGNPLKLDNLMKHTAFYVSFLEFRDALRLEEAWLTLGVLRTSVAKKVSGGFANALRLLLRSIFLGPESVLTAGVALRIGQTHMVLFIQFGGFVADEGAAKFAWDVKGSSGLLPCFNCKNVTLIESGHRGGLVRHDVGNYLVDLSCHDRRLLDLRTDTDYWHAHDTLEHLSALMTNRGDFGDTEKAFGINYNPHGILADRELRELVPPSLNRRDGMHTMLSNGAMNVEVFLLLRDFKRAVPHFSYAVIQTLLAADWAFPRHLKCAGLQSRIASCFNDKHEASSVDNQSLKSNASETLSLYPLIRYWVEIETLVDELIPAQKTSFLSLCKVADLLQEAKSMEGACARVDQQMRVEVSRYLECHKAAYGDAFVKPKHHFLHHLEVSEFYLDCFVHERKHKIVKQAAKDIQNTTDFEGSALLVILNATHGQMNTWTLNALREPVALHEELSTAVGAPCHVSNNMRWHVMAIGVGDVFLLPNDSAVQIEACIRVANDEQNLGCVVRELTLVDRMSPYRARWRKAAGLSLFTPVPQMRGAKCWFNRDDDLIVVT